MSHLSLFSFYITLSENANPFHYFYPKPTEAQTKMWNHSKLLCYLSTTIIDCTKQPRPIISVISLHSFIGSFKVAFKKLWLIWTLNIERRRRSIVLDSEFNLWVCLLICKIVVMESSVFGGVEAWFAGSKWIQFMWRERGIINWLGNYLSLTLLPLVILVSCFCLALSNNTLLCFVISLCQVLLSFWCGLMWLTIFYLFIYFSCKLRVFCSWITV